MKIFKSALFLSVLLLAGAARADYWGKGTRPHGHTSQTDGGVLGNFYSSGRVGVSTNTTPAAGTAFVVGNGTATFFTDGNVTFGKYSRFRVRITASQGTTSGVFYHLQFGTTDWDTLTEFNTPYQFVAKLAGWYEACSVIQWAASGAGSRWHEIRRNDSTAAADVVGDFSSSFGASGQTNTVCGIFNLAAGDNLSVYVKQDSGSALSILNSGYESLSVWRIP